MTSSAAYPGPSSQQAYPQPPMSAAYPPNMNSRWPTERRPGGPNRPHSLSVSVLADTHENYAKRQKLSQEYAQFQSRPTSVMLPPTPSSAMYPLPPHESRRSPSPSPYQGFAPLPLEKRASSWEWSRAQGDSRHPHHQHMHHPYQHHPHHHHPYGYSIDNMTSNSARSIPKQNGRHQRKRSAGCLNCHTVWSPTWRKDGQGNMRCNACGLYLAARGQERPLTLVPKKKGASGDEDLLSPLPRDSPHAYHPGYSMDQDESYPFPPYYQHPEQHHRPSPSFSHRSLAVSPGASSTFSGHTPDLLSPAHSRGHLSSSPNSSPFSFGDLSLVDNDRRLPPPPETPNCLGLNGITSRPSSAERSPPRSFSSDRIGRKSAPLNLSSPGKQVNEMMALSPVNELSKEESSAVRQALPPLSELTRGISSWKPQMRTGRQNSVSIDRIQTEALDARLTRSDRPPSA